MTSTFVATSRPKTGSRPSAQPSPHLHRASALTKRTLDVAGALLGLTLLAPVLVVLMLVIKFDSAGTAIYRQTRVGLHGQTFTLYKLRSMRVLAENDVDSLPQGKQQDGPLFKLRNDPRVTRVGRWLRKLSLDETPQLINVLRGEMSLVGPRPALPNEVASYGSLANRRLTVRPGLTGAWQVSGRADLDWTEGLALDLAYVDNATVRLDLMILVRTVPAVLSRRGAY